MRKTRAGRCALAIGASVAFFACAFTPAWAQSLGEANNTDGDSFCSSGSDEFSVGVRPSADDWVGSAKPGSFSILGPNLPQLQGWTNGTIGKGAAGARGTECKHEISAIAPYSEQGYIPPITGSWTINGRGEPVFVPDPEDEENEDAFTGYADKYPPDKGDEYPVPVGDIFSGRNNIASRYTPDARRWKRDRLPLQVYTSQTIDGARNGRVRRIIEDCMDQWCSSAVPPIKWEFTFEFKNADIYFLQRPTEHNEWADNERGYHKDGLNTVKISLLEQTVKYLPERRLKAVLLHQTGHALGLIDHLDGPSDAMSMNVCDVNTKIAGLSAADRKAIRYLYAGDTLKYEPPKPKEVLTYSSPLPKQMARTLQHLQFSMIAKMPQSMREVLTGSSRKPR